jgi:hypothetical protein
MSVGGIDLRQDGSECYYLGSVHLIARQGGEGLGHVGATDSSVTTASGLV